MDLQVDFLGPEGRLRIAGDQVDGVIAGMNLSLERAAAAAAPVVYVVNAFGLFDPANLLRNFAALRGSRGGRLDPRIARIPGALVLEKKVGNAFSNPDLPETLEGVGIRTVAIGGVFADACVLSTCRAALARGFAVELLTDAVGAGSARARAAALTRAEQLGARLIRSSEVFA